MTTPAKRRTRTKAPGIYRSVSGRYEICYRDSDGLLRFETVADTLEEAKAIRADKISKLARGEKDRRSPERFGAYADLVLAETDCAPRTREKHEYHLRAHLKPKFERLRLADVDVDRVAALVAHMKGKKYAGWTIAGTLSTLSLVMSKAQRAGYASANPVRQLAPEERPKIITAEKRILNEAEITNLLAQAGETFRPLIAFLIFTGVRLGEALGMTWADLDFDSQTVNVRFQLGRDRKRAEVKTQAGLRDVVFMPQLARVMREHKLKSPFSSPTDYVFANPDGRARDHRSTSKGIERAVARAKIGSNISAHSFRHTFASMLIVGLKYDPVSVSRQLGHEKASFTQDAYAHLFDKAKHADELRDRFEKGFGHLLGDVNTMSTGGGNEPQLEPAKVTSIAASIG